jgi:broad-specificity NMP kinase
VIVWLNGTHGAGKTTTSALVQQHAEAARTWLPGAAEVIDTTHLTPAQAAQRIAAAVKS